MQSDPILKEDFNYQSFDSIMKSPYLNPAPNRIVPLEEESIAEETKKNLLKYKRSLLKIIILIMIFMTIIIFELIMSKTLMSQEIHLLKNFQQSSLLGIDNTANVNYFYYLIGALGEFHIFFLIETHILITIYVSVDAFLALKTAFLQFMGCYIISILSMFYVGPRPFWIDSSIKTYFCDATFSIPGEFHFSYMFLLCYLYKSIKEKEEEVILIVSANDVRDSIESFVENGMDNRKKDRILRSVLLFFISLFLLVFFFRYAQGLSFLHGYVVGFVFFFVLFGIIIFADGFLQRMIKETTIMKNYAKQKIFSWLLFLFIAEALGILINVYFDYTQLNPIWVENMVLCMKNTAGYPDSVINETQYDSVVGPYSTLQETTIIFGLVGAIFGANTSFQNIPTLNWFKGPLKLKLIRAFIVNIMIIPSWFLIVNQANILTSQGVGILGIENYLINAVHFFVLYYVLFGIVPAVVFRKFKCITMEFKMSAFIPQKLI